MSFLRLAVRSAVRPRFAPAFVPLARSQLLQRASYSAAAGLNKEQITTRVLDVLKSFEKVDPAKVRSSTAVSVLSSSSLFRATQLTVKSKFAEDLGLDSLDAVEVVMAVEEARLVLF